MATKYTAKGPDGNMYSIVGPDNASDEAVQQELEAQYLAMRKSPDASYEVTPGEAFGAGMNNAAMFGFAPQLAGATPTAVGNYPGTEDVQNAVTQAQKQHPLAYLGGSLAGALPLAITAPAIASTLGITAAPWVLGAGLGGGAGLLSGLGAGINTSTPTTTSIIGQTLAAGGLGAIPF